jgi:hypothetical protein
MSSGLAQPVNSVQTTHSKFTEENLSSKQLIREDLHAAGSDLLELINDILIFRKLIRNDGGRNIFDPLPALRALSSERSAR